MGGQQRLRNAVRAALDRARWDAAHGHPPSTRLIEGTQNRVWDVMTRIRATAKHEYLSLDDTSYLTQAAVPERIIARGPDTLRSLIHRDIAVRQVTTDRGLAVDTDFGTILWRAGSDARVVRGRLPLTACVLDRRLAVVPLDLTVLAHGFVATTDTTVVNMVAGEHHALWTVGRSPETESNTPDGGPPRHLMSILPLLRDGVGDDVAARRIGVSPRTYSRRVKELLDLLDARSRFDAGMEVARRNWL